MKKGQVKQQRNQVGPGKRPHTLSGLSQSQRKTVLHEAQVLGISPSEYLTMILTLSKTIRQSLAISGSFDPKTILEWANNPLLTSLLSGLLGSVTKSTETGLAKAGNATNATSESASSNPHFAPQAPQRSPHGMLPQEPPGAGLQSQKSVAPSQQAGPPLYNPWGGWM